MSAVNSEELRNAPPFLTSSLEVSLHISNHLRSIADEYKVHACPDVTLSSDGKQIVLSGRISYHENRAHTDTYALARGESYLFLGHAAMGAPAAMRTAASVRRELLKQLKFSLPDRVIEELSPTSFSVQMADGKVQVDSLSGKGQSLISAMSFLKAR